VAGCRLHAILLLVAVAACSQPREAPSSAVAPPSPRSSPVDAAPPAVVAAPVPARDPEPETPECGSVFLFASPRTPIAGIPVRIVAVSDQRLAGSLAAGVASSDVRRGGPPYFWTVEVPAPTAGPLVVTFAQPTCGRSAPAELRVSVRRAAVGFGAPPRDGVWTARAAWSRSLENVYSAWVETLFDAPETEQPTWAALHEVLRDPRRNLLFDHLGAAEDSGKAAPVIRPDCADLPYFLRAYFAWKLGLPFGLAECSRGGGGLPPTCKGLITNEDPDERADAKKKDGTVATFGAFLRGTVADHVHSGSARTAFDDETSDYYPVKLSWESLRPGTVYADPYGHVLVVAKRIPQTAERAGRIYAVDGQPDGTVARKRFWRGNFLYAHQRELGGPGFKHFRPLVRRGGHLVRLDDAAIAAHREYGDVSRDPGALDVEDFYDAMDDVLAPRPLDPREALMEMISALEEQVRTRVQSVDNGRKWLEKHSRLAAMPDGPEIFETTGAWEDFATPSRDLRLLIAIDVVSGFPTRVARRSDRYAASRGSADVEAELGRILERELKTRSVAYTRSDGTPFTLTLAEVLTRSAALEMAYNPNDCVEARWGAPPGSDEAATCAAHAPSEQRLRMESFRPWFHERRRPPRR
jgi:hypothetical protein